MGFRIKEHQERRKLEAKTHRNYMAKNEALKFKELAWAKDEADEEFLKKLENIKTLINSSDSAQELAKKIDYSISEDPTSPQLHKDFLKNVIKDLL